MIEDKSTGRLDFGALRDAIEGCDPEALLGFYSEDAELRIINAAFPESVPFELKGRSQIERYLRAICNQQMTCGVEEEVVFGEGSVEFVEVCTYPNGNLISVRTTLEIDEGRILHQLDMVERRSSEHDQEVGTEESERKLTAKTNERKEPRQ